MASKKRTSAPLPPTLLYSLLKALGPEKVSEGQIKAAAGGRVDAGAKRVLLAAADAARQAKSPKQFATLLGGGAADNAVAGGGTRITTLTVEYTKEGYTVVTVGYSDGHVLISVFPTT